MFIKLMYVLDSTLKKLKVIIQLEKKFSPDL